MPIFMSADPGKLEMQKTYLKNLMGAVGPTTAGEGSGTLTEMSQALSATLAALQAANLTDARKHLEAAIVTMTESDLFKED